LVARKNFNSDQQLIEILRENAAQGYSDRAGNFGFSLQYRRANPRGSHRHRSRDQAAKGYLLFLALSALNFAQRAFVNLEIFALAAVDIARLRGASLWLTDCERDEV
jgi:hypothetical protein